MLTRQHVDKALVAFFGLFLAVGLAGSFIDRDPMPDFREQRALARWPTPEQMRPLRNVPAQVTQVAADNFGLRKPLMSAYFFLRLKVLGADLGLPADIGPNGWLFVAEEVPVFRREIALAPAQAERIRQVLDAWCRYAHGRDAQLVFFIAPDKSTIYPQQMDPKWTKFDRPAMIDQVMGLDFQCDFVRMDMTKALAAHPEELLYYKWGTHWNDRAAQIAWEQIKEALDKSRPGYAWPPVQPVVSYRPALPLEDSMWQWFGLSDPDTVQIPQVTARPAGPNPAPSDRTHRPKLLVFGDSFLAYMANTAGLVANDFTYRTIPDPEPFKYLPEDSARDALLVTEAMKKRDVEVAEAFKPNVVVLEVVERSIPTLVELPLPGGRSGDDAAAASDPFYITDANWIRGVARHWAGFFVRNEPQARALYAVGRIVRFADGQQREIVRVEEKGGYFNVFVDGPPLDGDKVGFPKPMTVLPADPAPSGSKASRGG